MAGFLLTKMIPKRKLDQSLTKEYQEYIDPDWDEYTLDEFASAFPSGSGYAPWSDGPEKDDLDCDGGLA